MHLLITGQSGLSRYINDRSVIAGKCTEMVYSIMLPLMTLTLSISLLLILLCCLAWFYACKFHICLLISGHGLWEWFMNFSLFAWLTYVNVLYVHWIVRPYYYGFLVNEGIGLILVIQTFYPSVLSVLYSKDVCAHPLLLYDSLFFLLL